MKITTIGKDLLTVSENNINNIRISNEDKIHLVKFDFFYPTPEKIKRTLTIFKNTNRYIICNNIKIYNYVLKYTSKKYYIMNMPDSHIITFLRKNNKILFNFLNLNVLDSQFFLMNNFEDLLKNVEVIVVDKEIFKEKEELLKKWNGDVIICDGNNI